MIQTQLEIRNSSILTYVKEKNTEFNSYDTITPYVMKKLNRYQSYVSPGIAGAVRIIMIITLVYMLFFVCFITESVSRLQ